MKELVLWNDSYKIPKTWGDHRIHQRSSGEDPVRTAYQKPQALKQTGDSLQWMFASQDDGV